MEGTRGVLGMSRLCRILFLIVLTFILFPLPGEAADLDLEKDLQKKLAQTQQIVRTIREKQSTGLSTRQETKTLKGIAEDVAASHLLMKERFKLRDEKVKGLNSKARQRQAEVSSDYHKALEEYLAIIRRTSSKEDIPQSDIDELNTLLDRIVRKKKLPIIGSLPYRHLNYPAVPPTVSPTITPAYRGGNQTVNSSDTSGSPEAPITLEIAEFAQSLGWSPVAIYEYVKNNIETEWYWGCMKGAEETLHQKSGNDCDQATLLTALLRASGYPTRYVRGVVEFFPDIEKAKNLIGVTDPNKLDEFFRKAGIPHQVVMDGTTVKNIRIDHIYVETYVPYSNYRGVIMDDQGKIWLALDTALKAAGYTSNDPPDIISEFPLTNIWNEYLGFSPPSTGDPQLVTPLEYVQAYLNAQLATSHPGTSYSDYLFTRTLTPEVLNILPSSLQFKEIATTGEYTSIPAALIHTATFMAKDAGNNELLNITLDAYKLSNHKVIISYEPESVDDHETINLFGGLDNTPAYMVHLRPVLMIDDEQVLISEVGVGMGEDYDLTVSIVSPNGTETFTNTMIAGNMTAIGIVNGKAVVPATIDQQVASNLLYREALKYIDNWNKAEDELSSLLRVTGIRPVPSVVTLANQIDVTYVLDQPHGFEWKGVFLDADLKIIENVANDGSRIKTFMQLSGLQGSVLEGKLFKDAFNVDSISTAKLFQLAPAQPATVITIDQANIADINSLLPDPPFADNIKADITDAVTNQGLIVRIPQSAITYQNWTGVGYIKENTATGEAGYMLSGMVAGGMTAIGPLFWPEPWLSILEAPSSVQAIDYNDTLAPLTIRKVGGTDYQPDLVVDRETTQPLMVEVADANGKPVKRARVTFSIDAGGQSLRGIDADTGDEVSGTPITVFSDSHGRAKAWLKLGKLTSANPSFILKPGDLYQTQVGENIVTAGLTAGETVEIFTELAFPDKPTQMVLWNNSGAADIMSYYGSIGVYIKDQHGNPIANIPVDFQAKAPIPQYPDAGCNTGDTVKLTQNTACRDILADESHCADAATSFTGLKTYSDGGIFVGAIMGNVPGAIYPIEVVYTSEGVRRADAFSLNTGYFGNCYSGYDNVPSNSIFVKYSYQASEGGIIEARKAGVSAPVRAKAYVLSEGTMLVTKDSCGVPCEFPAGNRSFSIYPVTGVTFNGQAGADQGNGIYETQFIPALGNNDFLIVATGSISQLAAIGQCGHCENVMQNLTLEPMATSAHITGVDIQTPGDIMIPVDQNGYVALDTMITYTIRPSGTDPVGVPAYHAATAQLFIYRNGTLVDVRYKPNPSGTITEWLAQRYPLGRDGSYEYEVVLNYGYGLSEIRSLKHKLKMQGIYLESADPAYPNVKLRYEDYYPALGGKKITVRGMNSDGAPITGSKVRAQVTSPTNMGISINSEVTLNNGTAEFTLTAPANLGPMLNSDPTTGTNNIQIKFTLMDGTTEVQSFYAIWNVKTNANTNLQEVLEGKAVFTYDTASGDNHKGKTTANKDEFRELDYVQMIINHIMPPLRTPHAEEDLVNTIAVTGSYTDETEQALKAIIDGLTDPILTNSTIVDTEVSHRDTETNSLNTFKKLMKDYNHTAVAESYKGKVIDREILVGLNKTDADHHPVDHNDIGILELYENDDWDGDGIGNYIEVENSSKHTDNSTVQVLFNPLTPDTTEAARKLLRSFSRGSYGIKSVRDIDTQQFLYFSSIGPGNITTPTQENNYTLVEVSDGLRVPDVNRGYYYFWGADTEDSDNYANPDVIRILDTIGKEWDEKYPYLPLHKDAYERKDGLDDVTTAADDANIFPEGNRFGVHDFSRKGGVARTNIAYSSYADWYNNDWNDHITHENGLDIDVRYMSTLNPDENGKLVRRERRINFDNNTGNFYDRTLTYELMKLFVQHGATTIYVDKTGRSGIVQLITGNTTATEATLTIGNRSATVKQASEHHHHFHVAFERPYQPVGTITFTPVWNNTTRVYDITTDVIRDSLNLPLLWNTALNIKARDELGAVITSSVISFNDIWTGDGVVINDIRPNDMIGYQIATDNEGKIRFMVQKPTSGNIVTVTIESIIGTAAGTVTLDFTGL